MGDVTGPTRTLPGARHKIPEGTMCDEHPDRVAVARVQGETDSFGSELIDMCVECLARDKAEAEEAKNAEEACDWCGNLAKGLRNRRDFEEGLSGRVYRVCEQCVDREDRRLEQEAGYNDDY